MSVNIFDKSRLIPPPPPPNPPYTHTYTYRPACPQVKSLVSRAESEFGPVDILVNNAGLWYFTMMTSLHEDDWERMVDVNCKVSLPCKGAYRLPSGSAIRSFHVLVFRERLNSLQESLNRSQYLRIVVVTFLPFPERRFLAE